jgi:hypothetical protein
MWQKGWNYGFNSLTEEMWKPQKLIQRNLPLHLF